MWNARWPAWLLVAALIFFFLSSCTQSPPIIIENGESTTPTKSAAKGVTSPTEIFVHVAGEVQRPGLYRLLPGSRVNDAVQAAGGVTPGGNAQALNLAALLRDGEKITVPTADQSQTTPAGSVPSTGGPVDSGTQGLININTASAKELETLPGIGPVLAQRIVDVRTQKGSFQAIEELRDVSGIGEKRLEAIRDLISLF